MKVVVACHVGVLPEDRHIAGRTRCEDPAHQARISGIGYVDDLETVEIVSQIGMVALNRLAEGSPRRIHAPDQLRILRICDVDHEKVTGIVVGRGW